MKRLLALMLLIGCSTPQPTISPRSCGSLCSSSAECSNQASGCGVCFRGVCSNSLPAEPIPDAGIDSPTK